MAKMVSDTSIGDLLNKRMAAKKETRTLQEEREVLARRGEEIDAKSKAHNRAYTDFDPRQANREPLKTYDNRDDVIKQSTKVFKERIASALGKGGMNIDFDAIDVSKASPDTGIPNLRVIDKALITFAAKIDTPTKPVTFYGAVDYDMSKDRHERVAVREYLIGEDDKQVPFTSEVLKRVASKGDIKSSDFSLTRKLVHFDMSDVNSQRHAYKVLPAVNPEKAKGVLEANGYKVASRHLGKEAGSIGHVYELIVLPEQMPNVKKVLAASGEWKEFSRENKNDEFKGPLDSHVDSKTTEKATDFPGRSREKNPAKGQTPRTEAPTYAPHSDEDKAMSQESEESSKWPGRSIGEKEKDVNRKTKNDEFDGNHMSDDRTEKASEFPGRTMEKGEKKINPKEMLRYENKRTAQNEGEQGPLAKIDGRYVNPELQSLFEGFQNASAAWDEARPEHEKSQSKGPREGWDYSPFFSTGNEGRVPQREAVEPKHPLALARNAAETAYYRKLRDLDPEYYMKMGSKRTAQGVGMPGEGTAPLGDPANPDETPDREKPMEYDGVIAIIKDGKIVDPKKNAMDVLPGEPSEADVDLQPPTAPAPQRMAALSLEKLARRWVKASKKRQANMPLYSKDPMKDPAEHEAGLFDDPMADGMMGMMGGDMDKKCTCGGHPCVCGAAGSVPADGGGDVDACISKMQAALDELKDATGAGGGGMDVDIALEAPELDEEEGSEEKPAPKKKAPEKKEEKKPEKKEDDKGDDDGVEKRFGSFASIAEYRGRRLAKYLDSLGRKGYMVAASCFCRPGTGDHQRCLDVGCSNNPACNMSRGAALITAEKAGKADMLKAKSNPTPDVTDQSRPMDGMHKRDHDGGERVVPSERGKAESQVRKGQVDQTQLLKSMHPEMSDEEIAAIVAQPNTQLGADSSAPVMPSGADPTRGMGASSAPGPKMLDPNYQSVSNSRMDESGQMSGPGSVGATGANINKQPQVVPASANPRRAIVTTGTGNDPPKIPQGGEPMTGMGRANGDGKKVVPSEEAGAEQKVPGITKNPSENITEGKQTSMTGMERGKKFTPPEYVLSGATRSAALDPKFKDALKEALSGPEAQNPSWRRIYASKNQTLEQEYEMKRKALISKWSSGQETLYKTQKAEAALKAEFGERLASLKVNASDLGHENAKGGEGADKQKGREKYAVEPETVESRGKDWFDRASESEPWKSGWSKNLQGPVKEDEGKDWKSKVNNKDIDNPDKFVGRTQDKLPYEGTKMDSKRDPTSMKPKTDEGQAMSGKDDPTRWEGRAGEKGKAPSKNVESYMMKDSQKKEEASAFVNAEEEKTADMKKDESTSCCAEKDDKKEDKKEWTPPWLKDKKEASTFVSASRVKKKVVTAEDKKEPKTSYEEEKNDQISEEMPKYEYKARLEEGRDDQDIKEFHKMQPEKKSQAVDDLFGTDAAYLDGAAKATKVAAKTVTAIDQDGVSGQVRRHTIDQHVGRVQHVGHVFKGNDVVMTPGDMVYEDLRQGRKPNGSSPYSVDYFVDRAVRGMSTRDYMDSNSAFRQIVASEEAKYMSDHQKMRFAELLTGYGLVVDDDVIKKAMKEGNVFDKAQRAEEDVVKSKK